MYSSDQSLILLEPVIPWEVSIEYHIIVLLFWEPICQSQSSDWCKILRQGFCPLTPIDAITPNRPPTCDMLDIFESQFYLPSIADEQHSFVFRCSERPACPNLGRVIGVRLRTTAHRTECFFCQALFPASRLKHICQTPFISQNSGAKSTQWFYRASSCSS